MGITKTTLVNDDFRVFMTTEDETGVRCNKYRVDFTFRYRSVTNQGDPNNKKNPFTGWYLGEWAEQEGNFYYFVYGGDAYSCDDSGWYEYKNNLSDEIIIDPNNVILSFDCFLETPGDLSSPRFVQNTSEYNPRYAYLHQYISSDKNAYIWFGGRGWSYSGDAFQYSTYVHYKESAPSCTALYPSGQTVDNHAPTIFQWTHTTDEGFQPYGYDLQYSYNGIVWNDIASVSSIGNTTPQPTNYTVPAYTFDVGVVYWRVRTYNTLDVAGEWAVGSFIADSAPDAPVIQSVTTTPVPTIQWTSNEQVAFRVTIGGLFDSGVIYGTATRYTAPTVLPDGGHIVTLSVANASGKWTASTASVTTANAPSGSIDLVGSVSDMTAALSWTKTGTFTRLYLLRDGVPIKDITGLSYFTDSLFPGASTYLVRGLIEGGNYVDSNSVALTEDTQKALSIVPLSAGNSLRLRYNLGSSPQHSSTESATQEYTHYAGRTLPAASLSGFRDVTHSLSYSIESGNVHALSALIGKAVFIRDRYGRAFGVLESAQAKSGKRYTALTLSLTEIDYQEAVDYVV